MRIRVLGCWLLNSPTLLFTRTLHPASPPFRSPALLQARLQPVRIALLISYLLFRVTPTH